MWVNSVLPELPLRIRRIALVGAITTCFRSRVSGMNGGALPEPIPFELRLVEASSTTRAAARVIEKRSRGSDGRRDQKEAAGARL